MNIVIKQFTILPIFFRFISNVIYEVHYNLIFAYANVVISGTSRRTHSSLPVLSRCLSHSTNQSGGLGAPSVSSSSLLSWLLPDLADCVESSTLPLNAMVEVGRALDGVTLSRCMCKMTDYIELNRTTYSYIFL